MNLESLRRRVADLNLLHVLLAAVVVELALNRLAVPVLRPPGEGPPPGWHRNLDLVSLFVFHLTSTLALGVAAHKVWEVATRSDLFAAPARRTILLVGGAFLALATWSIFLPAPAALGFHLETSVTSLVLLLALALALRPGDPLVKVGLLVIASPLLLHYYATFTLRVLTQADTARWSSLPDLTRTLGQWSLGVAAVLSPICFSPRPLRRSLLRPGPLAIAGFVGTIGAVVMRKNYEVGMELASRGLGLDLGVGAPTGTIALYVAGAAAVAWTITAAITAPSPARRMIGVGLALVVCGGYAFAWPLQHLSAACGIVAIAQGGAFVQAEEAEGAPGQFLTPAILPEAWQAYVRALEGALQTGSAETQVQGDVEETRLGGRRQQVDYQLSLVRVRHCLSSIETTVGAPPSDVLPTLTVVSRPEGLLAMSVHPSPPATRAPHMTTGDFAFDRRFRVQGERSFVLEVLDEPLRARAAAVLDGWLALWPGGALRYKVCPGRGAPLDHPIPVTELAFRGPSDAAHAERLVSVVDLICQIAARLPAKTPPTG